MLEDSPYRTKISGAVLKMQEDGRLFSLKEKWWKQMYGGNCEVRHISSSKLSLNFELRKKRNHLQGQLRN